MKITLNTKVVYDVAKVDVRSVTLMRTPADSIQVSAAFNWIDGSGNIIRRGGYSLPFGSLAPLLPPEVAPLLAAFEAMVPLTAGSFLYLDLAGTEVTARTSTASTGGARPSIDSIAAETLAAEGLTTEVVAGLVQQLAVLLTM